MDPPVRTSRVACAKKADQFESWLARFGERTDALANRAVL
jgi:hypothetical protein